MLDLNDDSPPLCHQQEWLSFRTPPLPPSWVTERIAHVRPLWVPPEPELDQGEPGEREDDPELRHARRLVSTVDTVPPPAIAASAAPRGYNRLRTADLADRVGEIARRVLGPENQSLSTREQLRFGTHGSISVEIEGAKKGTWFCHETNQGGGAVQLVAIKGGVARDCVLDWLRDELGIEIEGQKPRRQIVTSYVYTGEAGKPLARKLRWEPKFFSWERADGVGGWTGGKGCMNGVPRVLYRLREVMSAAPDAVVYIVEGEKDADNGAALGLLTTCNPDGGSKTKLGQPGKWRRDFSEPLRGRNVVIIPDNDEVGRAHAETVANALAHVECKVQITTLPGTHKDLSDWLEAGGTREQLDALVSHAPLHEPPPRAPETEIGGKRRAKADGDRGAPTPLRGLPIIEYAGGRLSSATDDAERIIAVRDPELFQRSDFLVRLGLTEEMTTADGTIIKGPRLVRVESMHLRDRLTQHIDFQSWDARMGDYKSINCPPDVAVALLQRHGLWNCIRSIAGIATAPTLRADGSIADQPGYDPATRVLYIPPEGVTYPTISPEPTKEEARRALDLLIGLLDEFPFVAENGDDATGKPSPSRSVALSGILTPLVRGALPTAPVHAFSAAEAGSGKSKLVSIASVIARGHEADVISGAGNNPEEFEKKIATALMGGDAIVAIDNLEGPLGGELLCSATTEAMLSIRVLGLSKAVRVPNKASFFATGNSLIVIGDMVRRAVLALLDARVERPELRTFLGDDPVARAKRDRHQYVAAALTVLRAFHVAGRPRPAGVTPLGSFEAWSGWVREALIWLGEDDPCLTMERTRTQDPKLRSLSDVLHRWHDALGDTEVSAKRLIEIAIEREPSNYTPDFNQPDFKYPDLREALLVVAGVNGSINSARLGNWLSRNKGRVLNRKRIETGISLQTGGAVRWKVVRL